MAFTAACFPATFPAGSTIARGKKDVVAIDPNSSSRCAGSTVSIDAILFQMLVDSVDEIYQLHESPTICQDGRVIPGALQQRIQPWQRGQIVNSASFIRELNLHSKWSIPRGAVNVSQQILSDEAVYLDELQAASLAGIPWQGTFDARLETCVRCGKKATWRFVLNPTPKMPVEIAWRLARPENAVPICHKCVHITKFNQNEHIRFDLAWGLWAARFEALHRWYMAVQCDQLPKGWAKEEYPLWPKEYGGPSWQDGSGALIHCLPRPPRGVKRSQVYFSALNRAMGVSAIRRERNGPYFSKLRLQQVIPDPNLDPGGYYCECGCIYRGTGTCSYCSRNRNDTTSQAGQVQ
jgi:hypothetical protein